MSLLITQGLGSGGGGSSVFQATGVTNNTDHLTVTFSGNLALTTAGTIPSNYPIGSYDPDSIPVTVTGVSYVGSQLTLAITRQNVEASYYLTLPVSGIISGTDSSALNPPYVFSFTGNQSYTTISLVRVYDCRTIEIIFSDDVVESDALTIGNYSISPTIAISSISKVNGHTYHLHTSRQTELVDYTITTQNIRDIYGTVI